MSQPIKYWASRAGGITANKSDAINDISDNSALVAYSDYAALAAEVERMKEGNECLDKMHEKEMARSAYLCEQNERLRKAGDTVVAAYCMGDWNTDKWKEYPVVAQWLAAKEGSDAK